MTATKVTMKTQFRDGNVRAALARLGPKVAQNVMKRSMRKALDPVRVALRQTWVAAGYKGKPLHRRAIDKATRIDVRRAGGGVHAGITGRVGVMYGKGGGTGAGGRQKIWHLLEAGFRHYAKGSKAYANFSNAGLAREWVCGGVRQEIRNEVGCSRRSTRRIANRGNCAKAHFFALVIATIVRPRYTAADGVWWWW